MAKWKSVPIDPHSVTKVQMLADSYWKGYAPQNQSALAQRMIETLKAYLSHSRQLSLF